MRCSEVALASISTSKLSHIITLNCCTKTNVSNAKLCIFAVRKFSQSFLFDIGDSSGPETNE